MRELPMACPFCADHSDPDRKGKIIVEATYYPGYPSSFTDPGEPAQLELDWPTTGKRLKRWVYDKGQDPKQIEYDERIPICDSDDCIINTQPKLINAEELLNSFEQYIMEHASDYFTDDPY